jgi:hypothetical protein
MAKIVLNLQPSEAVVVQAAATIFAAYLTSGRVKEGQEHEWYKRALTEACQLARDADDAIQSDSEVS